MTRRWCDNALIRGRLYYRLCVSEKDFDIIRKRFPGYTHQWVSKDALASTHMMESGERRAIVVCVGDVAKLSPIKVASLIVHESVHVWQAQCEYMAEASPGDEIEAYAIEQISMNLMEQYAEHLRKSGA